MLTSFKDWFHSLESSAFTRSRNAAFFGLGPKIASPFSRSTPNPGMVDKLLDDISDEDDCKKKKKKKKKKVDEGKAQLPDYSFDAFVKKMKQTKDEIDQEIKDAEDEDEKMDDELRKQDQSQDKENELNHQINKKDDDDDDDDKDSEDVSDEKALK